MVSIQSRTLNRFAPRARDSSTRPLRARARRDRLSFCPRAWALSPGVAVALAAHRPDDSGDDAHVFAHAVEDRAAATFRAHLELAGISRPELFRRSGSRRL
jgi:hypothetical protein